MTPVLLIQPYKKWQERQTPDWWSDYNSIKHERTEHEKLATLDNSINIIAGLFEIISQHPKFIKALYRINLLKIGGWNPELILNKEAIYSNEATLVVESEIFATTLGVKKFPSNIKAISPSIYQEGDKLLRYLL